MKSIIVSLTLSAILGLIICGVAGCMLAGSDDHPDDKKAHADVDDTKPTSEEPGHDEDEHEEDDPDEACCPHEGEADASDHDHGEEDPLHEGDPHEEDRTDDLDEIEDGHEGHAHAEDAGADDHEDEGILHLSEDERAAIGLRVQVAGHGSLSTELVLAGDIVPSADHVVHVTPRSPGIAREVHRRVGDRVLAGDILAWIESSDLGDAKATYLASWAELGCCAIDFTRAQEVHDNTVRFLELLKTSPSVDGLRKMNGVAMGEHRSSLVSAYSELLFSKSIYDSEKALNDRQMTSERDYQAAEAAYKKADALYEAKRDAIEFKISRNLLEAERAQQIREIEVLSMERQLYVLGLTTEDIEGLQLLALGQSAPAEDEAEASHVCTDPSCKGCDSHNKAIAPNGERLAWSALRSPSDGTIIQKHLSRGEKSSDDEIAFTVADLSSVWVNLTVYPKDLSRISVGQDVTISFDHGASEATGVIDYVSPMLAESTRTATARVVLPNEKGQWRPGLFVTGRLVSGVAEARTCVPKSAVVSVEGETVVFVEAGDGFKSVPVTVGRTDRNLAEIVAGLSGGEKCVTAGAFELKAKIVTSGLGAHAGHGH